MKQIIRRLTALALCAILMMAMPLASAQELMTPEGGLLTVQIVIIGAELNAEIEHQTAMDTTTGEPAALGERGAVVADTVGPRRGNPAALAFTMRHAEALSDRLLKRRTRPR